MTKDKLKAVLQLYLNELNSEPTSVDIAPQQMPEQATKLLEHKVPVETERAHCKFMCIAAQKFVDEDRIEKAMRWLGFLQGVLWARGFFTLDDLKNHSRPDSDGPST